MCEHRVGVLLALERLVAGLDPEAMSGEHAKELVGWFSRVEHLAAAGKTLCAGRVAATGIFAAGGQRSAATWLAAETGDSVGGAIQLIEAAKQLKALPVLEEAFRAGGLSPSQMSTAAGAASADPSKEAELLDQARKGSMRDLRRHADRIRAAARSEEDAKARYERIRSGRSLRWWTDFDGFFRLDARLTPDIGARLVAEIEPEAKRVFREARCEGRRESFAAYVADALVNLVAGVEGAGESAEARSSGAGSPSRAGPPAPRGRRTSHSVILRVDLAALRRGDLEGGEICETPGVGPVPLATARQLMGDAFLKLVITDGVDVQHVSHIGRHVSAFTETALQERDPVCVVPGCDAASFFERDHWKETFADGGPTDLPNLCRICSRHHHLKHNKGFTLRGGPGKWEWISPTGSPADADEPDEVAPWRVEAGAG
jgi:hypothetical protein